MTSLMDLALETRDFEWAKQLWELLNKENNIQCELSDLNSKIKYVKSLSKKELISLLQQQGLYLQYLHMACICLLLDQESRKDIIKQYIKNPNPENVDLVLEIINKLVK